MRIVGEMILVGLEEPHRGRGLKVVLDGIPKRQVPPVLERKAMVSGWAFHAKQGLCLRRILYWVLGVVAFGITFVPFWLGVIDKLDLQNAFAPVTFLVTMVTLWLAIATLGHALK
jgi:hypothetical protein